MKSRLMCLPVVWFLLLSPVSHARILHVPAGYPSIQSAVNAAVAGDTVLVAPGNYHECVSIGTDGICVASLFLVTGDSSYISKTIIRSEGTGINITLAMSSELTRATLLSGFTITGGNVHGGAVIGGSPTVSDCRITGNHANQGAGLEIWHGSPLLKNVIIDNNNALFFGGGILLAEASPQLINVTVRNNQAKEGAGIYSDTSALTAIGSRITGNVSTDPQSGNGGGICLKRSLDTLIGCTIDNNSAAHGGGIYLKYSNAVLQSNVIENNNARSGGGLMISNSRDILMERNTIRGNRSIFGGGIYLGDWMCRFSSAYPNSIYGNRAVVGNELYYELMNVVQAIVLDTFPVQHPHDWHARPRELFNITVLHPLTEQSETDLFVSPSGNDTNSGLSAATPLRTLGMALSKVRLDETRRPAVHLSEGTYSSATNGEYFPIGIPNYATVCGAAAGGTILEPDSLEKNLWIYRNTVSRMKDIAIRRGGIYVYESDPVLENLAFTDTLGTSSDYFSNGAMYLDQSNAVIRGLAISGYRTKYGNIVEVSQSDLDLSNLDITGCFSPQGSMLNGFYSQLKIRNAEISGNTGTPILLEKCSADVSGVTLTTNSGSADTCSIYLASSTLSLANSILWDEPGRSIVFDFWDEPCEATIHHSDIRGGEISVITNGQGIAHWGDTNMDREPQFTGDTSGRIHSLARSSPCVDACGYDTTGMMLPPIDLAGNPRIWNGIADMGAYEWNNIGVRDHPSGRIALKITPNPASDACTIQYRLPGAGTVHLEILNCQGITIREMNSPWHEVGDIEFQLVTGSMPAGTYLARVTSAGFDGLKEFVVVH